MEFFTIGNILTLGIVALVLFLYRQLDRHNNTVDKLQKFAAQVKEELGEFVAEKEGAVKDYGIALDVHQKAAKELLRRLQITDEELAHKAAAVAKIDERLSDYDVSLEELVRMTVRVQENLNRIQEESAFVEKVNKRVSESKEKLTALEKGLGEIERHFEQENADFLERVAQQLTLEVKSKIDDFQAEAEVIARHVEDNREAIERTEHIRSEQIRRDLDLINKTLDEAIEKAVARADNLEDSSLVKLREEAFQRVQQVHSAIDEKIKTYQESAKIQVTELQHLVTDQIDTWKNDTAEWEMQHRSHKDTWKKDIQEMNDRIEAQREAWELVVEDGNTKIQQFLTEMNAFSDESRERFTGETEMMEQRLKEVQHNTEALIGSLEQRIAFTVEETERKTLEATGERLEQWKKLTMETDANTRRMLADLETASGDIKTHFVAETAAMEERLKDLQAHTDKAIASLEDQVKKTATNIETTVLEDLGNRLEQGKQAAEERDSKAQQILSQMETSAVEFKTHFMTETAAMEEGLKNLQVQADEAILSLREQVAKVAADTEAEVLEDAGARLEQWKQAAEEGDAKSRTLLSELEASTAELKHYFVTETMGMEARLKELREHTDEAIAALRDQVVQAAEDTQTKVWTDTGTRLEQWKQTMEESDARSRQLLSDLETVSVETEKHISHEIAEATGRLDALQTKMDETVSHIEDEIANAGEKALVLADAELEKWKQAVAAEDTKVREIFADWETSLGETKEHISHELNAAIARVDALEVQIGETASRIEGDMTKAVTAAEEKALALADRELEKWRQTVETEDAKIRENLAALEASLGETKQQISHELNTAIGKVETLEAQIGETAAQIEGELTKAMSGASEKALALGDAELDKWRQTVETEDAKIRENLAALEISLGKTKQQVSDELNATTGKVEALETKIGETASRIEGEMTKALTAAEEKAAALAKGELEKWKQTVETEDAKIRENLVALKTSFGETKQQMSDELNATTGKVEALETKIGETASRIEGEMTKALTAAEEKAAALAKGELEKWKQTVETEDAKIRENLAALETSFGETKQQVSDELNATTGKVEALETKIGETASRIEGEMTKALTAAEEKAAALAKGELEKWKQTVEGMDVRSQNLLSHLERVSVETEKRISDEVAGAAGQFEGIQAKIHEIASRIEEVMAQAVSSAEEKALTLTDRGLERWKAAAEEGDARARQLLADLEATSAETKRHISHEIATTTGQFEGIQAKIHEIASRIEEVMAQAVSSAEEKALTLTDRGLERWKAAAEEGDTRARQLLADLETVSAETKQRVFDEIAGAEKQLETLQDQINAMAFHITDEIAKGMQSAQEKASALAGEELKKWQSALEAEDTKTQDMLAHFKTASAESEKNLTDLEQRLTKISGEAEQKALAGVDTQFEKWKQAAEEADAQVRKILGDLETALGNTQKHISQELVAVEGQIEPLEKRINEAASLIDHEMALAVAQAKEKALIAAKEEDNKARALLADLETAFGNTKKQIFDDITSAQEQIGTIQKKIDEANGQIENAFVKAVSSAEERALVLADQGIEKWKQTVEAEDAKIHQVLGNLETASRESEKNIADLEQRLVKITGDMEQKVLEVTNERLEHWKLITSEAETNTRQVLVDLEAASAEIKTHFTAESVSLEQRLKDLQGYADEAMGNLKVQVEQIARKTEQQALEAIDTQLEKWTSLTGEEDAKVRQNLADLEASFVVTKKYITDEIAKVEAQLGTFQGGISETVSLIEQKMTEAINHAEEKALYMEQKVLEETDAKFEEYRMAQAEQFNRLGTLADDTAGMDAELRRHMAEIENRVREDFSLFEQHSATTRDRLTEEFAASVQGLKAELEGVKQELEDLKARAYQNVSEQLQVFEGDFSTNLAKKQDTLDQQFSEWQESLKVKLEGFMEESAALCRNTEQSFNEELQHTLGEQHEQFLSELEQLKAEISNFEEGIRSQMKGSNDGLDSFKAQLHHEMTGLLDTSRQELDKWQAGFNTELQGLDASMNEVCRRAQELIAESDERLKGLRSAMTDITKEAADHRAELFSQIEEQVKTVDASIKDADRHIKEFVTQTKLFERTDELKVELERRLEELRGDFDRIDQRRIEATDLEDQFVKIKRLEDEVNAKMTRFLSEKYRIEQMETEFNRLLQVSAAVEEKLTEVSNSDDTLQGIQIQIRKLNDALGDAEEKYQRIEKKNQTLDVTNDGIDRNFKSLQESEKMARYITDELNRLAGEQNTFRLALETLTAENTRARETADKLSLLDTSLSTIEERIEQMQKVRQWLARAETRLEELNKQSQDQIKLMGALMKDTGKTAVDDKGAPPIGVRENIVKLAQQGWNVDEISRAVKRSRGEVELILELMPKE